ncbi:hypothetical protein BV210_11920 [Halorientalis sp. IM1011]|uniref:hypothetical protein n=1 Tax=Halorientalis sp. IM1011 TaxID=1932360 RepID=UPI00097CC6A6|nr:hypothetical protein [Halorientalis sp. IM1011]AQL43353.1 hypothetical protein BV210_11920 [Halorientalis sp. IM1011]
MPRPGTGSTVATAEPDAESELAVDVGLLIAHSPREDAEDLRAFADRLAGDVGPELASATGSTWRFFGGEIDRLPDATSRRPSEFLDEAALRMVEGPYDLLVVVTDAPLVSRRETQVPGLASPLARVVVLSTWRLRVGPRTEPTAGLDAPPVRWNGAALLLHLLGHVLGAEHDAGAAEDSAMAPFRFDPDRRSLPAFDAYAERYLRRVAADIPETESTVRGPLGRFAFHLRSAARNPDQVLGALAHSGGPFLPLSLPKLSTAALMPALILVFSAETWDVGINLSNGTAALFAAASVFAAAVHVLFAQNLFFPRERSRIVTEHTALINVTAFLILLSAMVGLFVLVGVVMLVIEFAVFPPNLMTNWPSLEDPQIGVVDLVRTGAFISTVGVLSGALAGGLENRTLVRHLALFRDRP